MANFLAVVDPNRRRRDAFLARVAERVSLLSGLAAGSCAASDFAAAWAAGPRAPVSHDADRQGAAVLFGDALLGRAGTRLDARRLRAEWRHPAATLPPVLDGYHAGVAYRAEGESGDTRDASVVAGADVLGWYPLYWFARGDVLLVASSPELMPLHPLCETALDPAAVVGVLMLNGLAGPGALLAPIRRLPAGHLLAWSPERGGREIRQYAPPSAWAGEDLPWHAYVERLDATLADAVRRHVGDERRCGLLLSGGLDSRMLAGYLHRQGTAVDALTYGLPSDVEMRCAVGVARRLGFTHRAFEVPPERLPANAELQARWEHLASGFSSVLNWGRVPALADLPARVAAGYGFDHVLHANTITPRAALRTGAMPFAAAFAVRNASGLSPALLKRLLRAGPARDAVDEVYAELASFYDGLAASDFRRYWAFALSDRVRHHIGAIAWRMTFAAWPVLPVLDHRLLDAVAALPVAALSGRRLQNEIVATRFPALAALPLDHGSTDDTPLAPRLRFLLRRLVTGRLARLRPATPGAARRRKFFARTYDFDGPAWRLARQLAEPHRAVVGSIVDDAVLAEVLPPPDAPARFGEGVTAGGAKLLVGLILWARDHLSAEPAAAPAADLARPTYASRG